MLGILPRAQVEQILISLPLLDLVAVIRTTSRIYEIAISHSAILKRLKNRRAVTIKLTVGIFETKEGKVGEEIELYIDQLPKNHMNGNWTGRSGCIYVGVWRSGGGKRKEDGFDKYVTLRSRDFQPFKLLHALDKSASQGFLTNRFQLQLREVRRAVKQLESFLVKLCPLVFVKELFLTINGNAWLWFDYLAPMFNAHPGLIRCRPYVQLYSLTDFNGNDFYSCAIFDRGVLLIEYDKLQGRDPQDRSMYHDALKTARIVIISGNSGLAPLRDHDLWFLFSKAELIRLENVEGLTATGIGTFFRAMRHFWPNRRRNVELRDIKTKVELTDILKDIPEKAIYHWKSPKSLRYDHTVSVNSSHPHDRKWKVNFRRGDITDQTSNIIFEKTG